LKFDLNERTTKEAAKKGLGGLFEAIDTIVNTCDSRIGRNILSGFVKSLEDACAVELATKQVLLSKDQPKLPARVENIEKEQSIEKETGSISNSVPSWAKEDESQQATQGTEQAPTAQKVSKFHD